MINIKGNIDHIREYFYTNEYLLRSELIKLGSYDFYDKYLCDLSPREYLDLLQILIDDVIERTTIIPDETTYLTRILLKPSLRNLLLSRKLSVMASSI